MADRYKMHVPQGSPWLAPRAIGLINLPIICAVASLSFMFMEGPIWLVPPIAIAGWCLYVQHSVCKPLSVRERWRRSRRRRDFVIGTIGAIFMAWQVAYPLLLRLT